MENLKFANIIKLSNRENQVCNLLISGTTTSGIAKVLNIKCNTVSTIKKSIYYKTKATNIIELYEIYKQA
jgi:DNA-binding NarL/FixJ family response regulator